MTETEHVFDASAYLEANPDVAKAIEEGRARSAWSHFVEWGFREHRTGVPNFVRRIVRTVMETPATPPPAKLISRVHGTPDASGFENVGKKVALDIYSAVNAHLELKAPLRILDFGCGCGRVLSYMKEIAPHAIFHASDIDEEAIDWCRGNYRGEVQSGRFIFTVNRDLPPLPFDRGYFDFVYGISVFTHLPEDLQLEWLGELNRITRPGGLLVISIASDILIRKHLTPENIRMLDGKGFYYFPYGGTDGLPTYYQAAWHTRAYVEKVWSKYFKIIEHTASGIAGHQDLVLCLKQ
jgi:SAM-dependent methyltransferase